ncbi:hypothetical protein SAMN05192552_10141, partial [Natrinema hispanicum]
SGKRILSALDGRNLVLNNEALARREWSASLLNRGYTGTLFESGDSSERFRNEYSNQTPITHAVRALGWYRQFREIVLMFALINIESLCEPL